MENDHPRSPFIYVAAHENFHFALDNSTQPNGSTYSRRRIRRAFQREVQMFAAMSKSRTTLPMKLRVPRFAP
jgi:hypothetical protein